MRDSHGLVAAVCGAALLVAACGASVAPATPPPTTTPVPSTAPTPPASPAPTPAPTIPAYLDDLQGILAATSDVRSARMEYEIRFSGSSAAPDGPLMSGAGEFRTGDQPQVRMNMDMSAAGLGMLDAVQDGDIIYMRSDAFRVWDPQGRWIRVDTTSDHPNAVAFSGTVSQTDPWAALAYLLGATRAPETLEPDTMDGDEVRHLRVETDIDLSLERAPAEARDYVLVQAANFREQGVSPLFVTDLWVDDADRIRRAEYTFEMSSLHGGGNMILRYDLSDFGVDVVITIPEPEDVVDVEELDLNVDG